LRARELVNFFYLTRTALKGAAQLFVSRGGAGEKLAWGGGRLVWFGAGMAAPFLGLLRRQKALRIHPRGFCPAVKPTVASSGARGRSLALGSVCWQTLFWRAMRSPLRAGPLSWRPICYCGAG